ncbi:MAG: hypothetical protein GC151_04400 [Betaproteobacteria bacterium]|nr:hypothetical protein [Betaproteobacteria bacterium]
MASQQNRATLRNYFKSGKLPTEDHFADLIESTLNMVDEGYRKSPEHGVEISALGSANALVSFYTQRDPNTVQWSIAYGADTGDAGGKRLVFAARDSGESGPGVMSLDPLGRVGLGNDSPSYTLDVNGVIRSAGRIGGYEPGHQGLDAAGQRSEYEKSPVAADGKWHDITGWLSGCQGFEVVAGVGDRQGRGRYALLHAIALNTFNPSRSLLDLLWPRRKIRAHEAYFSSRCDRLELKWEGAHGRDARYRLMIRTRCPYSDGRRIQYFLTRLWFDPDMDGASSGES